MKAGQAFDREMGHPRQARMDHALLVGGGGREGGRSGMILMECGDMAHLPSPSHLAIFSETLLTPRGLWKHA